MWDTCESPTLGIGVKCLNVNMLIELPLNQDT